VAPIDLAFFYEDYENRKSGGTGRTIEICQKDNVPFLARKEWMRWFKNNWKMNKKILYLDMDGVVADFEKRIGELSPDLKNFESFEDQELLSDKIDQICFANPELYHDLPPIEGAVAAVEKLSGLYDLYFLSTAMWDLPQSFTGKRIWIARHFEIIGRKRLILTHRKDLLLGDFLVDDRLKNGAAEFQGEHIHFGTEKFPDWEITSEYLISRS
jgi:5'(3')-deoxyribonucleotidase